MFVLWSDANYAHTEYTHAVSLQHKKHSYMIQPQVFQQLFLSIKKKLLETINLSAEITNFSWSMKKKVVHTTINLFSLSPSSNLNTTLHLNTFNIYTIITILYHRNRYAKFGPITNYLLYVQYLNALAQYSFLCLC